MTTTSELIRQLADGQRSGARAIDATTLPDFDLAAAYEILAGTQAALGEATGMLKTAIFAGGTGVAAPIYASRIGRGPGYSVPADRVVGLEVEVGVVLAKDIASDPGVDENAVAAAVDHYFTGVEIVGTRFVDRDASGPLAGLADNMSAYAYVIGERFAGGREIADLDITLNLAGSDIYSAPAKHGFGTVLASLAAYARAQQPNMPLKAGTIITTGSMCGLVRTTATGHVVARFGNETIELDLV